MRLYNVLEGQCVTLPPYRHSFLILQSGAPVTPYQHGLLRQDALGDIQCLSLLRQNTIEDIRWLYILRQDVFATCIELHLALASLGRYGRTANTVLYFRRFRRNRPTYLRDDDFCFPSIIADDIAQFIRSAFSYLYVMFHRHGFRHSSRRAHRLSGRNLIRLRRLRRYILTMSCITAPPQRYTIHALRRDGQRRHR